MVTLTTTSLEVDYRMKPCADLMTVL